MTYCKIGGIDWKVLVTAMTRSFENRQGENSGESLATGRKKVVDVLGTFISYTITFAKRSGYEKVYDALWDFVATPRTEPVDVEFVYNQETIKYKAYITSGTQDLNKIRNGKVIWDEITLTFEPSEAQIV